MKIHYCRTMTSQPSGCGLYFITPRTDKKENVTCKKCKRSVEYQTNGEVVRNRGGK